MYTGGNPNATAVGLQVQFPATVSGGMAAGLPFLCSSPAPALRGRPFGDHNGWALPLPSVSPKGRLRHGAGGLSGWVGGKRDACCSARDASVGRPLPPPTGVAVLLLSPRRWPTAGRPPRRTPWQSPAMQTVLPWCQVVPVACLCSVDKPEVGVRGLGVWDRSPGRRGDGPTRHSAVDVQRLCDAMRGVTHPTSPGPSILVGNEGLPPSHITHTWATLNTAQELQTPPHQTPALRCPWPNPFEG